MKKPRSSTKLKTHRQDTDKSLATEREKTDVALTEVRGDIELSTDKVVEQERIKDDQIKTTSRIKTDHSRDIEQRKTLMHAQEAEVKNEMKKSDERLRQERIEADCILELERARADAVVSKERELINRNLEKERDKTDHTLHVERTRTDVEAEQISNQVSELESKVNERTKDLEVAKLAAESANHLKSEFLANMSHEIRTPLAAVLGFSELIIDPSLSVRDKTKFITAIKRNGELLSSIINDILDLSKVEVGKMEIERREVAVRDVVSDISTLLRLKASEKGITFNISCEKNVPKIIKTDHLRLKQILVNLVGNAIKFTERGSVDVIIKFAQKNEESGELIFVIKDTGIGIKSDQLGKLFKVFSQTDSTMKRRFAGTGLGLALSKHLANLLGGDVVLAASTPNGSTFTATVDAGPALKTSISEKSKATMPQFSPAKEAEVRLDGVKVLVVEDSLDNQILVGWFLKMVGAKVDTAENGELAMEKVRHKRYDVVLMDIQMPVMDGYETTAELRKEGYNMPIIALTAYAREEERERCLSSGFTDHISKPINRKTLINSIAHLGAHS